MVKTGFYSLTKITKKINIFQIWQISWIEKSLPNAKEQKLVSRKKCFYFFLDGTNLVQMCQKFKRPHFYFHWERERERKKTKTGLR